MRTDNAWFRRRKYGLGWALHRSWQGWLLILVYLILAVLGVDWFQGESRALSMYFPAITVGALVVCWWKGERSIARGADRDGSKA